MRWYGAIAILMVAVMIASCGDDTQPTQNSGAPHREVIFTHRHPSEGFKIMRSMSDGSGQRVITPGYLVAPPVAGRILYIANRGDFLYSMSVDGGTPMVVREAGEFGTFQSM